jgi:hypothetical protein
MQHIFLDNDKLSENITSLKDMRTAIHKLLPEDLENPNKENVASTSGDQGPNEGPIEDDSGTTLVSCTCDTYQEFLTLFIQLSQKNNLNISSTKFGSILSPMNKGEK